MECSSVTSILCCSQAKDWHRNSPTVCKCVAIYCLMLKITQREKTAGRKHFKKGAKIREEEKKKEIEGGKWDASIQCFHSLHPPSFCHRTRMRVLSLKSTLTQHAHRQGWLCEHMHTRMKAHTYSREAPMQGSGGRLQDQRSEETQIKTSQNHHCLYSGEKQQAKWETNNAEPSINVAPVS